MTFYSEGETGGGGGMKKLKVETNANVVIKNLNWILRTDGLDQTKEWCMARL
jgi:hypothetical protein